MFEKGNQIWKGRKHTEETRRKISRKTREAAKRRREQGRGERDGYRMLIAAIVRQAIKDNAAWFFETETGKSYCAVAGIDPAQNQRTRRGGPGV